MIKIKYIGGLILTVTFLLGQAVAQGQPSNQSSRKYKMTTTIPAGIEIPNTVKTSLGAFEFYDGVPNQASKRRSGASPDDCYFYFAD